MRRITLALLLALLFAPAAWAAEAMEECDDTDWTAVDGTNATATSGTPTNYTLRDGECLVYRFTGTEDSDIIYITAETVVTFDPSIDADGADAAQVYLRRCEGGNKTVAANTCPAVETELGTSIFTGAAGLKSRTIPRGYYYIDNAADAAGDTATVTFDAR